MLANFGWTEILMLSGIVILLFGAKRFPIIGRSLGQGISNLFRGLKGTLDDDPPPLPPADREENQQPR
jgi:TatA/E family protein of Tat protein translocase